MLSLVGMTGMRLHRWQRPSAYLGQESQPVRVEPQLRVGGWEVRSGNEFCYNKLPRDVWEVKSGKF